MHSAIKGIVRLEIIMMELSNGAKQCSACKNQPSMSYLVRKHKEKRGDYHSDSVFEIFLRREDRACCIFYSPVPSEIEEGVGVIHPV